MKNYLTYEIFQPHVVDAAEAFGFEGGIALLDAKAVLVYAESQGDHLHLAIFRIGEDELVVGSFEAKEAEGGVLLHVLKGDIFHQFQGNVVQTGIEDLDLFDEFAGLAHKPAGASLQVVYADGGLREADQQVLLVVDIHQGIAQKLSGATLGTLPQEKFTA